MEDNKELLWKQRIQECLSSGLSVRKWCKENHISSGVFYYWKNRVEKKSVIEEGNVPVFVEVTPTALETEENIPASLHITWNELHFDITSKEEAELAAYFLCRVKSLCYKRLQLQLHIFIFPVVLQISENKRKVCLP